MTRTLALLACSALLVACATGPAPYGPAASADGFGYSEQFIEDDRVRVSYAARSDAHARDRALL
ncbi:MAG: hypothetical protein WBF53_09360, partial [Litorimonas sp.]